MAGRISGPSGHAARPWRAVLPSLFVQPDAAARRKLRVSVEVSAVAQDPGLRDARYDSRVGADDRIGGDGDAVPPRAGHGARSPRYVRRLLRRARSSL